MINSTKYTNTDDLYDNDLYKLSIGTRQETTDVVYKFGDDLKVKKRDSVFIKSQNITTNDIPIKVAPDFDVLSRSNYPLDIPFTPGVLVSRKLRPDTENTVTVDLQAITVDGAQDTTRYNSSTDHIKDNIREIGETEKNFMPLWMRSSQVNQIAELGMINAIPLCYCKPGTSATVANKLNLENIDFSVFDFDIDRVLIDSSQGVADEQYIVFANYEYNV